MKSFKLLLLTFLAAMLMSSFALAQINFADHIVCDIYGATQFPIDMDDDDDIDIFVVGYQEVYWCENNGFQGFEVHMIQTFWDYGMGSWAGDVDGDDDIDCAGCAWSGDEAAWWENDGSENFTYHSLGLMDGAHSITGVDLDEDGDVDFVGTGDSNNALFWFEQNPIGTFTQILIDSVKYPRYFDVVDFDHDNDLDILTQSGLGPAPAYADSVLFLENDGSENFTKHYLFTFQKPYDVKAFDWDGDNDYDIVACSFWGDSLNWYENDGTNYSFTNHNIGVLDGCISFTLCDLDNDQDVDIVSCATLADYLAWFENDGNQNFTQHIIPNYVDYPQDFPAVDLDEDGDFDLVVGGNEDLIHWYENDLYTPNPVTITLTPASEPVTVPPGGGSFNFDLDIENTGTSAYVVDIYTNVVLPNGSIYPLLFRGDVNLAGAAAVTRNMTQFVPGSAMPGHYTYGGHVCDAQTWQMYSEDFFNFEKLEGDNTANHNMGWACLGWDVPLQGSAVVENYDLFTAYPNPFNPQTTFTFALPQAGYAALVIYDIQGREVARLINGTLGAGLHQINFNAANLASGVYFAKLKTDNLDKTVKLLLTK